MAAKLTLNSTERDINQFHLARATLAMRLRAFQHLMLDILPALVSAPGSDNFGPPEPENVPLRLPSNLTSDLRTLYYSAQFIKIEGDILEAACQTVLEEVRRILRSRGSLILFKINNVRGVKDNTRSHKAMRHLQRRLDEAADTYRSYRETLLSLRGPGEWEKTLQVLRAVDVRAMNTNEPTTEEMADALAVQLRELMAANTEFASGRDRKADTPEESHESNRAKRLAAKPFPSMGIIIKPLQGAVNSRTKKGKNRTVSWIWLGSNLGKEGNKDPEGKLSSPCHS
jgi:hypothetical protein